MSFDVRGFFFEGSSADQAHPHPSRGTEFVDLLKEQYEIKTSQGLISKYESGITNPPADLIDKCIEIIHGKNVDGDISLTALEMRMRKVLRGPSQAGARKAFAVILDSLA